MYPYREVRVFGYVGGVEGVSEGIWVAGIIDELAMEVRAKRAHRFLPSIIWSPKMAQDETRIWP